MLNTKLIKILWTSLALPAMLAVSTVPVFAADAYPAKQVRIVVPFPPGGGNDIIARAIAPQLSTLLDRPVVVDNRGGAGGVIGTEVVAKAPPDGSTLLLNGGSHSINDALIRKLPYDSLKSFTPIARLITGPSVLAVHPSVPASSAGEFIALAKKYPGKLNLGTAGVGASGHMGTELLKMMAKIDFAIVHYKGGGPVLIDLLGGQIDGYLASTIATLNYINSGRLKVLATGGLKRSVILPNVQTFAESGVPGYESTQSWGLLAPAGVPAPIVDRLNREIKVILGSNEIQKLFLSQGGELDYLNSTEFGHFIEAETVKWKKVVKEANISITTGTMRTTVLAAASSRTW